MPANMSKDDGACAPDPRTNLGKSGRGAWWRSRHPAAQGAFGSRWQGVRSTISDSLQTESKGVSLSRATASALLEGNTSLREQWTDLFRRNPTVFPRGCLPTILFCAWGAGIPFPWEGHEPPDRIRADRRTNQRTDRQTDLGTDRPIDSRAHRPTDVGPTARQI